MGFLVNLRIRQPEMLANHGTTLIARLVSQQQIIRPNNYFPLKEVFKEKEKERKELP